jgi:hypothetical protein
MKPARMRCGWLIASVAPLLIRTRHLFPLTVSATIALSCFPAAAQVRPPMEVRAAVKHDVSPPLWAMPVPRQPLTRRVIPWRRIPHPRAPTGQADPVLQRRAVGRLVSTTPGVNFAGVGVGAAATPGVIPSDANGKVGPNHYVQWVNDAFAVFSKSTGAPLFGPVPGNTLWSGFGGGCETNNDGDPIVQYDRAADRWIMTQFSVSTTPYLQCVAVSTTPDPTGSYSRYAFNYGSSDFPDYPKLAVWPDAYYITYNIFSGG